MGIIWKWVVHYVVQSISVSLPVVEANIGTAAGSGGTEGGECFQISLGLLKALSCPAEIEQPSSASFLLLAFILMP